jgi:hypothetical protein
MVYSTSHTIKGNFIQILQTAQGQTQFSFLRKGAVIGEKYFILAMDKNLRAFWFSMERQGGQWKIIEAASVPDWISDIEDDLSAAILLKDLVD